MKKMTKGLTAILVSLFMISLAASSALAGIKTGIKGGITLANVKSVPDNFMGYKWENKMGLAGGVFLEIGLPGPLSIQPEVLYVQKGAQISVSEAGITGTFKAYIDYIEIPLLLKFNLVSGGPTVPSIYAGPYVGFNTKAEFVIKITGYPEQREDVKDDVKNTEFGMAFGLGLAQKLGVVKLTLDARYDLGISNIIKETLEEPSSIKTRTWLFMVGFSF